MKLNKFVGLPAVALVLAAGGCEDGLTDINLNPNEPEVVPAENLLANAIVLGVGGEYGTNGSVSGLFLFNLWPQYMAAPEFNEEDRYSPRSGQVSAIWDVMYTGPLQDLKVVKELAIEGEDENLEAVSQIYSHYLYQYLTDIYGDIPYSESLQAPAITAPVYDAQRDVYYSILDSLDTAAAQIDQAERSASFGSGDLIYSGDMLKWYRFANSLRMRAAMRLVNVEANKARDEFIAAYNGGGMQSNADNAVMQWSTSVGAQNPRYDLFVNQGRRDQVVSAAIITRLSAWDDPRLEIFAEPAASDGAYRGLPNGQLGADLGLADVDLSFLGSEFLEPDAPSVLMPYSEVLFLQAEAAFRGWIPGDPADLYRRAIRASMEQYGIPAGEITAYLAQPEVAYNGLNSIWTQKWVALFMVGIEGWSHIRRTGVPALTPAVAGQTIPSRLYYPDPEALYNPGNYRPGLTVFDPIWWEG
jgi:hypothetical protein